MDNVCNTNKVQNLNEFIKNCITQAFIQLLRTKEFNKISITEICQKAGVARVSFYRNFNSKEDVLVKYIEKIFFDVEISDKCFDNRRQLKELHRKSFGMALKNRDFFSSLHRNNLLYLIYDSLERFTPVHISKSGNYTHEIQSPFFIGATYGVIRYWIESNFNISVEQLSEYFADMTYKNKP